MHVCEGLFFYLHVNSMNGTQATRLVGQAPLPSEPELPCLPSCEKSIVTVIAMPEALLG